MLGPGSEVIGFDTEISRDHDWGPRCQLFFNDADVATRKAIWQELARSLPPSYAGFGVAFGNTHRPDPPYEVPAGGIAHQVAVVDRSRFFTRYHGFDPAQPIGTLDWLATPTQKLLSVAGARLFRDELGVADQQARLAFYPDEIWRFAMARGWSRIGENEHLVGRAAMASDLGWRALAATLVRDMAQLGFLLSRRYAPLPQVVRRGVRSPPAQCRVPGRPATARGA